MVGFFITADQDTGDTFTYTLVAGAGDTDNASFTIVGNQLLTNAIFDYETKSSYSVRAQTDDGHGGTFAQQFTIAVNNINDAPVLNDQIFSLPENSTNGTSVGTMTGTDPDVPAQTLTYAITAGNTGGAFAINGSSGQITVATSSALNYEVTPTFNLTVQVTDNGTPNRSDPAAVTINLTNVNEAPVVNNQTFGIAENSANGTAVGSVISTQ